LILLYVLTVHFSPEISVSESVPVSERARERLVDYVNLEFTSQLKNPYIFFLGIVGTFYFRKFGKDSYGGIQIGVIKNVISISIMAAVYIATQMGVLYSLPGAIFIMLLLAIGFVFGNLIQRIGIMWFGISFAPLLFTSQIVQPTYLAEPNLGMSILLGVTLAEFLKYIYSGARPKNTISNILNYANIAIVVLVIIVQLSEVPVEIGNTNNYHKMVSESQTSFREAVDLYKGNCTAECNSILSFY